MNLNELYNLNLSDTVRFHNELNPALFAGDSMIPEVRKQLLVIAEDFVDHLGLNHLAIADITVSGSSAAYSYTPFSDIDLHILVDMNQFKDDDVYRELFDAKKNVYNDSHDITIGGYEVELYVQDTNMPVVSLGEYSVLDDKWIRLPRKRRAHFDQAATKIKYQKLMKLAEYALKSGNYDRIQGVLRTLKKYRKAGLDKHGEFGPENLAYKALRNSEIISRLYNKLDELHSQQLSLPESTEDNSLVDELAEGWQNYIQECSGYIPSEEERNDPRWKMGLSVDITPNSIKDNARKLGSKIQRNGRPPLLRP